MKNVLWSILLLAWAGAQAHQDPAGDVHPVVSVEEGGFAVYFQGTEDRMALKVVPAHGWKMSFTADGKLVLPRHRVPETQSRRADEQRALEPRWSVSAPLMEGQKEARWVLIESAGKEERRFPLPLPLLPDGRVFAEMACRAGDEAGFAWSPSGSRDENDLALMFTAVSLKGFQPGVTVQIGKVASIYDMPRVSNPVWAARRWWIAWVRLKQLPKETKPQAVAWETLLTSIDPLTGKTVDEVLPGISNWNTDLSLKTTGGWLCAAWHASLDGSYPGRARIVTAFKKLPE